MELKNTIDFILGALSVRDDFYKSITFVLYHTTLLILCTSALSLLVRIVHNDVKLDDMSITATFFIGFIVTVNKLNTLIGNKDYIVLSLDKVFLKPSSFTKWTQTICKAFFILAFVANISWSLIIPLLEEMRYPTPYYIPFNIENIFVFGAVYVYGVISTALLSIIQIPFDSIFMLITASICDSLDEVIDEIKQLKLYINENDKSAKQIKLQLIKIVNQHRHCISDFRMLAELMDSIVLFQILQSITLSCFMSFVFTQTDSSINTVKGLTCLSWAMYQLFWVCWFGQKITNKFEALGHELFWSGWEECSVHHQKLILIAQAMFSQPMVITGASLFQVSLKTLMWSLNQSVSVYMFLRTVEKNRSKF